MDQVAKDLGKHGDYLVAKRQPLMTRWQELVDNFYPELDGFTDPKNIEDDFAAHLVTSEPVLIRRDLGDAISTLLRRENWFAFRLPREDMEDNSALRWMDWATGVQRRAMYDPVAQLARATKDGDHATVTFGQTPISIEFNPRRQAILYRNWHLKDVVWSESIDGQVDTVYREQKICAGLMAQRFPKKKIDQRVLERAEKDPYGEVKCRHIVVPSERLNDRNFARYPYVSLWVDCEHSTVLEMVGSYDRIYCIPRWKMLPGSQYAMSPAAMIGLPDARLCQQMMLTLLEAGEKAVNPPMLVREKLLKGGIELFANGLTYIDSDHDRRMGDAMEPVYDSRTTNLPLGLEMFDRLSAGMRKQWYLDKIRLPQMQPGMTAYEFAERMKEYARDVLPLIGPIEPEYNGQLCDMTFNLLMRHGVFGNPKQWPQSVLKAGEVVFRFRSPYTEASERIKATQLQELKGIVQIAAEVDPSVPNNFDFNRASKDAARAVDVPAAWMRSEEEVAAMNKQQAEQQQMASLMQGAQAASQTAVDVATAEAAIGEA